MATVAVEFILTYTDDEKPFVAFAAVPAIFLLMLVSRIGIFKYTTANRNLGYELHLNRLKAYERLIDQSINERVAKNT